MADIGFNCITCGLGCLYLIFSVSIEISVIFFMWYVGYSKPQPCFSHFSDKFVKIAAIALTVRFFLSSVVGVCCKLSASLAGP